jgi:signal transduction histidine kinase
VLERQFTATGDLAVLNRDELIQITTNLLRNSLQAIESRGVAGKIAVRTESHGILMTVDIVDNGIGIPEEKRRFLFEQGFTTKGPQEGTGLGLAICRRYAHAFGGEVELLYSEPEGRGTCFRITIPLKDSGSDAKIAS